MNISTVSGPDLVFLANEIVICYVILIISVQSFLFRDMCKLIIS
jgi:hypothetical protein